MVEINNKAGYELDIDSVRIVVEKVLKHFNREEFNVSLALVDDSEIQELNKTYRGKDESTDVLSFPAETEELKDYFLGEIVINYQQTKRQAKDFDNSPKQEFVFILVHGLLHLLGYEDESREDREKMIKTGEDLIKELSISI